MLNNYQNQLSSSNAYSSWHGTEFQIVSGLKFGSFYSDIVSWMMQETFSTEKDKNTENLLRITGDLHSSIKSKKRFIEPFKAMSSE